MRERCRELRLVELHMRRQLVDIRTQRHELPQFMHDLAGDEKRIVAHEGASTTCRLPTRLE